MTSVSIPAMPGAVPSIAGNNEDIEACATALLRACATFDDLDTVATSQSTLEGWNGVAADAYRDRVAKSAKDAAAASAAVRAGAKAIRDYADEFQRLKFLHETLVGWRSSLKSTIEHLHAEAHRLGSAVSGLIHAATDAHRSAREFRTECDDFEAAVAANDAALIAALNALMTVDAGRRLAAGGDIADDVMARVGSPMTGASPQEVAQWWRSLTDDEQFAVIAAYPEVIGAADGLPAYARDQANRLLLEQDIAALDLAEERDELSAEQLARRDNIRAAAEALANADGTSGTDTTLTLDPITSEPIPAFLLLYRPGEFGNDGAVAIAIGDPDTADNVAVSVPGIRTEGTSIPDYTREAQHLYESARLSDPHSSSATIAWIGYDHPSGWDIGRTPFEGAARDGGERLATYVDGLQAARTHEPKVMTVIGHSYGSTTSAHAASGHGLDADNLVLIGSPGAGGGVSHADDLNVPQVWAGTNSRDVVGALGDKGWFGAGTFFGAGLGNDPTEDTFGATRFQAEDPTRNDHFRNTGDHVKYYERGSESIFNMGQIMVGDYDEVLVAEHTYDSWWNSPQEPEWTREPEPYERDRKADGT